MAGQGCVLSFAISAMLFAIQLPPRAWLSMLAVAGKSSRETSCSSLYGLDEAVCVAASFSGAPLSIAKVCLIEGVCTAGGAAGGAVGSILPTLGLGGFRVRHRSKGSGPFGVGLCAHLLVLWAKEPHLKHALFR